MNYFSKSLTSKRKEKLFKDCATYFFEQLNPKFKRRSLKQKDYKQLIIKK